MSSAPDTITPGSPAFPLGKVLRLSTFQIGSAMGDILTASVWNRVMIADLGLPAWPIGLLIAFRYLLAPLSLWAGSRSDKQPILGWHRTSYIWLGRGLMVLSFPLLGASVSRLSHAPDDIAGWALAIACFLMYGVGTLISGSPFLALVRDSVPSEKQGMAIAMVETALIIFFPVTAIAFGRWMEVYNEQLFWQLVIGTAAIGAFFWFVAIVGQERRGPRHAPAADRNHAGMRDTLRKILADRRTRRFFIFLSLATFSAWMQDNVLEPFGADVFGLDAGHTTRFTGYWGALTVITLIAGFIIWRNRPPETLTNVTRVGLFIMAAGMVLLVLSGLGHINGLLIPGLMIFGAGFGLYSFGGLSLMAVMSPDPNAGAYLGLWTISILVSKGLGTFAGGVIRDLFYLGFGSSAGLAYGAVFLLSASGLAVAALWLGGLDVIGFARDTGRMDSSKDLQPVSL